MEEHFRPEAEGRKIHSKDEFELCYLRHQYLRRTTRNPDATEMAPYQRIIKNQAGNTYFTYKPLFASIGFEVEDLISIGQVQLVSFLGLFAVEADDQRQADFEDLFLRKNAKEPNEKDILNRNLATFTMFLKQRFEDVTRICRQKARNIKGTITEEYHVFYGLKKPNKDKETMLKHYSNLGYKKLDLAAFRTIRKKSGEKMSQFKYEGLWYICIPIRHKVLSLEDLDGADMNPHDALHNMNPEQLLLQIEENKEFEDKKLKFDSASVEERARIIKQFIKKNKKNGAFASELETAKKMLLTLGK